MSLRNRIGVLHGVNLDALDRRPAAIYGDLTFAGLEREIGRFAHDLGLTVQFFQTNHEGEYVEQLHKLQDYSDAVILNPGAWTHYAWAIRDALEICGLPAIEVHLSDVQAREEWRRHSIISELCLQTVSGQGVAGYRVALEALKAHLEATT